MLKVSRCVDVWKVWLSFSDFLNERSIIHKKVHHALFRRSKFEYVFSVVIRREKLYWDSTVLYCTVLYCTVLYCTVLYCIVLYCTVLYCTVLYCTVLYCTVLYCTVLYCTSNVLE